MTIKDATLFYTGFSGVTHADISSFLGKSLSTAEQTLVGQLVLMIEDYIVHECRKNFYYVDGSTDQSYQEFLDGGEEEYILSNYPIKEVLKIIIDGVTKYEKGVASQWTLGTDFFVYPYKILFEQATDSEYRGLEIDYTIKKFWGDDVKFGIIQWIAEIVTSKEYGGRDVTSANVDGLSLSFNTKKLPDYISNLIARYKRYAI